MKSFSTLNSHLFICKKIERSTFAMVRRMKSTTKDLIGNISKLECTQVNCKPCNSITCRVNISMMEMYLMHLFPPLFFQLTQSVSVLATSDNLFRGQPKLLKAFPTPSVPDKALGETVLGRPEAQIAKAQFTSMPLHIIQGIKSVYIESKAHYLISTIHYNYFET